MKQLMVCAVAWLICQSASGGIVFSSDARFAEGPTLRGQGNWIVEQAPVGSGIPMPQPENLPDGYVTAANTVFRYVAAVEDLGSSVVGSWVVQRDILGAGGIAANNSQATVIIELAESESGTATVFFEFETVHGEVGGGTGAIASLDGSIVLTPQLNTFRADLETFGPSFMQTAGADRLMQAVTFSFGPTVAGQEIRLYLPSGVISLTPDVPGIVDPVPEAGSLTIWCLGALGVVGAYCCRNRRRQRGWRTRVASTATTT